MLPLLGAVLVALRFPGRTGRAAVFGILLATAVLLRNEVVIAAAAWLLMRGYELWVRSGERRTADPPPRSPGRWPPSRSPRSRSSRSRPSPSPGPRPGRASTSGPTPPASSRTSPSASTMRSATSSAIRATSPGGSRTAVRSCAGTSTTSCRHSRGDSNESGRHGAPLPLERRVAPYGLQLALFDRTSGSRRRNPDYIEASTGSSLALIGSIAVLAVAVVGCALLWRDRRHWWTEWIRDRVWGMGGARLSRRHGRLGDPDHPSRTRLLLPAHVRHSLRDRSLRDGAGPSLAPARGDPRRAPLAAVALLVLVPRHYGEDYSTPVLGPGRGLADAVSRLEPNGNRLAGADTVLVAPHGYEICNYLTPLERCTPGASLDPDRPPASLGAWLDREGADFVYDAGEDRLRRTSSRGSRAVDGEGSPPGTQPRIGCFWGVNPPRPGEVRSELLSPLVPRRSTRRMLRGGGTAMLAQCAAAHWRRADRRIRAPDPGPPD